MWFPPSEYFQKTAEDFILKMKEETKEKENKKETLRYLEYFPKDVREMHLEQKDRLLTELRDLTIVYCESGCYDKLLKHVWPPLSS